MPNGLDGFRKRMKQDFEWDIEGKVFQQPTHLTFTVHSEWQQVLVHFALYRAGKRLELSARVRFEFPGIRKYVGVLFLNDRYYAFDYDGESGLLFLCFET